MKFIYIIGLLMCFNVYSSLQRSLVKKLKQTMKTGVARSSYGLDEVPLVQENISQPFKISKRCCREEIVGQAQPVSRKDLNTDIFKTQCERCSKLKLCKSNLNLCPLCKRTCEQAELTTISPDLNPTASEDQSINAQENMMTYEIITPDSNILTSRFGEDNFENNRSFIKYYTVGSTGPGPIMDLLKKILNLKYKDISRLIFVAKLNSSDNTNLQRPIIIDTINAFTNNGSEFPKIYGTEENSMKGVDNIIQRLNSEIYRALEQRKNELNNGQLSKEELNQIINRVMENNEFNNVGDDTVGEPEATSRCNVEDSLDNEVTTPLEVFSRTRPLKQKEDSPLPDKKNTNPSIIQDSPNIAAFTDKFEDLPVDDNQEGRPPVNNDVIFPNQEPLFKPDLQGNKFDKNTVVAEEEPNTIDIADTQKKDLESRDQVTSTPALRKELFDSSEESDGANSHSISESGSEEDFTKQPARLSEPTTKEYLANDIYRLLKDTLKIAENEMKKSEDLDPMNENFTEQSKNFEETALSQSNSDNVLKDFRSDDERSFPPTESIPKSNKDSTLKLIPKLEANTDDTETNEVNKILESSQTITSTTTADQEEPISSPQFTTNLDNTDVQHTETDPNLEMRTNALEDDSRENHHNMGSLIPMSSMGVTDNPFVRNLYFVGDNIKLPLRMYRDKDGTMQLKMDLNKLCECKQKDCKKKHVDRLEPAETQMGKNIITSRNMPLMKLNVDKDSKYSNTVNGLIDSLHLLNENSLKYKRSIEPHHKDNMLKSTK